MGHGANVLHALYPRRNGSSVVLWAGFGVLVALSLIRHNVLRRVLKVIAIFGLALMTMSKIIPNGFTYRRFTDKNWLTDEPSGSSMLHSEWSSNR